MSVGSEATPETYQCSFSPKGDSKLMTSNRKLAMKKTPLLIAVKSFLHTHTGQHTVKGNVHDLCGKLNSELTFTFSTWLMKPMIKFSIA